MTGAESDNMRITYLLILLAVFAVSFFGMSRAQISNSLKMLGIWVVITIVLVVVLSYWGDIKNSKFYASLVPGQPIMQENGEMVFVKADDGHFYINIEVNGPNGSNNIRFMVDTGASDIVFNQKDASKLGFNRENMVFDRYFSTANGTTRGASVKISRLKLGSFEMQDFNASVNEGELDNSLLGMSFLSRLKSYNFTGNQLVLRF